MFQLLDICKGIFVIAFSNLCIPEENLLFFYISDLGNYLALLPMILFMVLISRGGGGGGRKWHHDGRRTKKLNSVRDYVSCAKFLVEEEIVQEGKLAGWGYSAGGLLVASAINSCPDLFRAAVLQANSSIDLPFFSVDVVICSGRIAFILVVNVLEIWQYKSSVKLLFLGCISCS